MGFFSTFPLTHFIQRLGERLHDMEPVNRHSSIREMFGSAIEEGRRHVTHDFNHIARGAAMCLQKGAERLDRLFATSLDIKDHRLLLALHIEKYGDVA